MYLYIFDDGTLRQSQLPPTATDLECVSDGTLRVLSQVGAKFVEYDWNKIGKLIDIPEASQTEGFTIPDAE